MIMNLLFDLFAALILFLIFYLVSFFYRLWEKLPNTPQYILFLPITLIIWVILPIATHAISGFFFRDMVLSKNSEFWIGYAIPFSSNVVKVITFSLVIVFLAPKYEKTILKLYMIILASLYSAIWIFVFKLDLKPDIFLLPFSVTITTLMVIWKIDYFITLKQKYAKKNQ